MDSIDTIDTIMEIASNDDDQKPQLSTHDVTAVTMMDTHQKPELSTHDVIHEDTKNSDVAYTNGNIKSAEETKSRRNTVKRIVNNWTFFFALLCVVLMVLLIVFIVRYVDVLDSNTNENKFCRTRECVHTSSRIMEAIDTKVDPCDNFYNYACGNWIRKASIPDHALAYGRAQEVDERNKIIMKQVLNDLMSNRIPASTSPLQKATTFYRSCIDVRKVKESSEKAMNESIKKLGSWPVTDVNFNSSSWDSMKTMVLINKDFGRSPLFELFVETDLRNTSVNAITFIQSGLGMGRISYFSNETARHVKIRNAYRKFMKDVARRMGANEKGLTYLDEVFEFEKELAKITVSVEQQRRYTENYEAMTLKEFINRTNIPTQWLREFIQRTVLLEKTDIPLNERIVSFNTNYIKNAYDLFANLRVEVQASYLMWHAVQSMIPIVMGPYEDILLEYYYAVGIKDNPPRWKICVDKTIRTFGFALARLFVERAYDKKAKHMSTQMIQGIKRQFEKDLEEMDWLDQVTKEYAKKKASMITNNIGYPPMIFNNTELHDKYEDINMHEGQYFANVIEQKRFVSKKNYQKYGKPVDKTSWHIHPIVVNAYYSPTENKIVFPAGILQWPFYDKESPMAVSYGGIGMIFGHEISHAFDNRGKNFDISGDFNVWWTNYSTHAFRKKSRCFIEQYSGFKIFGRNLKGRQTLGENIADNGGIRQTLMAYRSWVDENGPEMKLAGLDLTPEQLLFLSFAQNWCTKLRPAAVTMKIEYGVHTIPEFRVIGSLQNLKEFSDAYNCPVGSTMNPERKCKLW